MERAFNSLYQREIGDCFSPFIPLWLPSDEIQELLHRDMQLKKMTGAMLAGTISLDELFEIAEEYVPDLDDYIDAVEGDLISNGFVSQE